MKRLSQMTLFAAFGAVPVTAALTMTAWTNHTHATPARGEASVATANPASKYCIKLGGKLLIETKADGSQTGSCALPDTISCDEWTLFRGDCPGYPAATDPFHYCAENGTDDVPPGATIEEPLPASLASAMRKQGVVAEDMPDSILQNTRWRCMHGQVMVCQMGANLPCNERLDLDRQPSDALINYCENEPDSTAPPAIVTGRSTAWQWICADGNPEIVRQIRWGDERGFISGIWIQLKQP